MVMCCKRQAAPGAPTNHTGKRRREVAASKPDRFGRLEAWSISFGRRRLLLTTDKESHRWTACASIARSARPAKRSTYSSDVDVDGARRLTFLASWLLAPVWRRGSSLRRTRRRRRRRPRTRPAGLPCATSRNSTSPTDAPAHAHCTPSCCTL
jgi:hypothetical protein